MKQGFGSDEASCDTPEQRLRQLRVALRLRRTDTFAKARWVQTLKLGGGCDSALSQRREREVPAAGAALTLAALAGTLWSEITPPTPPSEFDFVTARVAS